MKYLFLILIISGNVSCQKECASNNPDCADVPPSNEACAAYFNRWFYNNATNKCEQKGYSGCSPYGFETLQECEECECN